MLCLSICLCTIRMPDACGDHKRALDFPKTNDADGCELPCEC